MEVLAHLIVAITLHNMSISNHNVVPLLNVTCQLYLNKVWEKNKGRINPTDTQGFCDEINE